ncbi:hypothetical protein BD779DRAFT_701644 [Infundibulicybe gibba]|nr:hypothetical protein BD779DRAFT_701644 [Infundibulicybe gibba]
MSGCGNLPCVGRLKHADYLSEHFASIKLAVLDEGYSTRHRSVVFPLPSKCSSSEPTGASVGQEILGKTSFDFIIVGGGTTGLTVARRLARTSSKNILVLEAGRSGVNDPLITIPKNSFAFLGTDIDWAYNIAPQSNAAGQTINLSQGKVLGGDSAVNGLAWTRGPKEDYDTFEELGSPGWNWDNLFGFMKMSEKLSTPSPAATRENGYVVRPSSFGSSGPIDVSFPSYLPLQHKKLVQASIELGHNFNEDAYGGNNTGVFYSPSSQTRNAVRESAEYAYLDPVLTSQNIVVFTHAMVSKLQIESKTGTSVATGVHVQLPDKSGAFAKLKKHGEVILSAGVVRTPQLLELSGIGDKNILSPLGIDVKVDLPGVGTNYEDQPLTILTYKLKSPNLSFDALDYNATLKEEQQKLYDTQQQGFLTFAQAVINMAPLGSVLTPNEISTAKSILDTKPASVPQDQFDIIKRKVFSGIPQAEYILFNSFSAGDVKEPNSSYISMAVTHLHPLSRGSIHITSTSINDHPKIDLNVLATEWDLWFLAKATAYGRKFFTTDAFKEIVEPVEVFPGASVSSEDQWKEFVKKTVNAGYHSAGSASLLPRSKNGVVDKDLKVYGTSNIRVIDLSIVPMPVATHPQTIAYAVAEKAATIILGASQP